jgi:hypothetical protein
MEDLEHEEIQYWLNKANEIPQQFNILSLENDKYVDRRLLVLNVDNENLYAVIYTIQECYNEVVNYQEGYYSSEESQMKTYFQDLVKLLKVKEDL